MNTAKPKKYGLASIRAFNYCSAFKRSKKQMVLGLVPVKQCCLDYLRIYLQAITAITNQPNVHINQLCRLIQLVETTPK